MTHSVLLADLTAALNTALSYANPGNDGDARTILSGCLAVLDEAVKTVHGPDAQPTVRHHLAELDAVEGFATDHYLTIGDSLREVARRVDGLAMRGLPQCSVGISFYPVTGDDDEVTATIDTIGAVFAAGPGTAVQGVSGNWLYTLKARVGDVRIEAYHRITDPAERARATELERLRARIIELEGGVADSVVPR